MNGARPDSFQGQVPVPSGGSRGNYPVPGPPGPPVSGPHAQAQAQAQAQAHAHAQAQAHAHAQAQAHAAQAHAAHMHAAHGAAGPAQHQPRLGWHSPLDYLHRRELINNIIRLFQHRRPNIATEWQKKLPDFVRRLESALYQSAHSLEEYMDVNNLEQRLQSVARRMMSRARPPGSLSGANGQPVSGAPRVHPGAGGRAQGQGGSNPSHAQMQAMYGGRVPGGHPSGMGMGDPQMRMPPHHSMPMAGHQMQARSMPMAMRQQQTPQGASQPPSSGAGSQGGKGVDMSQGMMPMHSMPPGAHYGHHPVSGGHHPQGVPNPQHHMQMHQQGRQDPSQIVKAEEMSGGRGPGMQMPGSGGIPSTGPVMSNGAPVLMRNASFPGTPSSSGQMLSTSGPMQRVTINGMAPGQLPGHSSHMRASSSAGMPQQGMPYHQMAVSGAYHQKPEMGQMMRPPHAMTSAGMAPPSVSMPPSHGSQPRPDQHRLYIMKQIRWLLFLRHAHKCTEPEGKCSAGEHCVVARKLWQHIWKCTDPQCQYPRCVASRELLKHHQKCVDPRCPVCGPVRNHIENQRNRQLAAEQYRLCHKSAGSSTQGHKLQQMPPAGAMMGPYHGNTKPVVMMPPAVPPKRENMFDGGAPPSKRVKGEQKVKAEYQRKKVKDEKAKNSQGTSLLECFSPQQIRNHMKSLKVETSAPQAPGKAVATEVSKAVEKSECCTACGGHNLLFEPPPLYCLNCTNRIKKGQIYWYAMVDINKHSVCSTCYKDHIKDSLVVDGKTVPKTKLKKKKNEEKLLEPWVQCDYCDAWIHQVCALYNKVRDDGGSGQYACPNCLVKKMEKGEIKQITARPQAMLEAKDLARTKLSDFLEARLSKCLANERQVRATALGKKPAEVPTAEGLTIRIVNANDKLFSTLPSLYKHFEKDGITGEMKYRSKILLMFQKVDGVDLCLFCMYVQEYGHDCPNPNTRRTYLSYLDSVRYFKPEGITAYGGDKNGRGDSLRTVVYQEIIMGYLQYLKDRGFTSMYIWACPPLAGDDYIFYVHPQRQKTPKSDRLREWYLRMLRKAKDEGIVEKTSNLWDLFFEGGKDHRVDPCRALDLPYFEGDYIPGALEDYLTKIYKEREDEKKASGKKSKKTFKGSSSRGKSKRTAMSESVDTQVMSRLGDQIKNMKEDFIMVHLQPSCSYCRKYILAPEKRFTCDTCPNFELCERCYKDDCGLDERSKHPTGSLAVHKFKESIGPQVKDTSDPDPTMECEIFDTRQSFLSLCQGNHYQFDTFRRAKHSSMMVLYHLHNPAAPAFTSSCNACNREIQPGQGYRCTVCPDYDVCVNCKQAPGFKHEHPLKKQSAQADARMSRVSEEERRARQEQLRKTMELLVHASSCQDKNCPHPSCFKVKMLFQHSLTCSTKATGGCTYCRRMWALLQLHAKSCTTPNCPVPRCRDLKQYRRYAQAQAEKRRRMHYHQMMQANRQ